MTLHLPFPTIMFPGMLIGVSSQRKLANQIKGFHRLDYYGGKYGRKDGGASLPAP